MPTDIEVLSFKCDLENYRFLKSILSNKKKELEQIQYLLEGVHAIQYDKLPSGGTFKDNWNEALQKRKDKIKQDIDRYTQQIQHVEVTLSRMAYTDMIIVRSHYIDGITHTELGERYGYSRRQIMRIIDKSIKEALKEA